MKRVIWVLTLLGSMIFGALAIRPAPIPEAQVVQPPARNTARGWTPAERVYLDTLLTQAAGLTAVIDQATTGPNRAPSHLLGIAQELERRAGAAQHLPAPPRLAALDSGYKQAVSYLQHAAALVQEASASGNEVLLDHSRDEIQRGR